MITLLIFNSIILGALVIENRVNSKRLQDLEIRTKQLQSAVEEKGYTENEEILGKLDMMQSQLYCLEDNTLEGLGKLNENVRKAKMDIMFTPRSIKVVEDKTNE